MIKKALIFFYLFFLISSYAQTRKQIDSISNLPVPYIQTNLKTVIPLLQKNSFNARKSKNIKAEAKTAALLALAYYYGGDYDENIQYSLKAIDLFEKINDSENAAAVYGELGFRLKATRLDDAEKYMLKGLKIAEQHHHTKPLLSIYNNYGTVKSLRKQKDSALFYYLKGLELNKKENNKTGVPYSLNNIGNLYLEQGKFDLAKKYFDEAMEKRISLKDEYGIADNHAYNGDLYFAMKNYSAAICHYEKSLQSAEKLMITNLLRHNYMMISQAYEMNQNLPMALRYYKRHQSLKDSIINKETYDKMAELQMKFDTAQKEKQILEQQHLEKKRKNTIRTLIILFAFLIIISFLVYRTLHLKNKQQQQEFKLKEAISEMESQSQLQQQRLSISRDLHDNIGAQLTFIISSVETLQQAFRISDENINSRLASIAGFARETITELRDTIWAMNRSRIDFNEIRIRILNFTEKAQESQDQIQISFERDESLNDIYFSSVSGMNIYRIIQESVHNAIKYSGATSLLLKALDKDQLIEIHIIDNGKGFDKNHITYGNGLRNMQKRAAEMKAELTIETALGEGVHITLVLPKPLLL